MAPLDGIEDTVRRRLRAVRHAGGWSIDDIASRAHLSASTVSRLETGGRRITLEHLVALAGALHPTVDALLVDDDADDVVIRPVRDSAHGHTFWLLSRPDDPSGRVVAKMKVPARKRLPDAATHPGREWFTVLDGTVRLVLGDHEHLIHTGEAAEFDTMRPHVLIGHGGPAEVLSIFDRHGERVHLQP